MRTIRQQLTRKLLLSFALLIGLGGIGVYLSTRAALLDQFDQTLRAKANAISSVTEQRGERVEVEFSEQFMHEFDDGVAVDFFQLRRPDGTTIRRSESLTNTDLPPIVGKLNRHKFWNLKLPSGFRGRAIGYNFWPRISKEGEPAKPIELTIVVASDRRELDETLATLVFVLLGCGVLLLVTTAFIVPRVLRRELVPLNQLADQAARITADSLATRFATETLPGELTPIGSRLNDLLARLEQSFERERRFSADLAHELRTPIAELRSLAELALKWPEAREVQTDREALAIALQMEGLVSRLLALLRSERGLLPVTRERVVLAPLVESVWKCFAEKAAGKQQDYSSNVPEDAAIETDPVVFRSILANLLDNAVEYTPRGGMVQIDGGVENESFTLRVTNTAEHLALEDVANLFDRFWRKDAARSGTEHSGLGLSLSRAFARALGYEITAALDGESRLMLAISGTTGSFSQTPPVER
jgi:two-component system sensor histidine kinase QseC